jgi:hypothetical protein
MEKSIEYFKQQSEYLLKAVYGIGLIDITDRKEIELHFHLNETPYQFVCYLGEKYDLEPKQNKRYE